MAQCPIAGDATGFNSNNIAITGTEDEVQKSTMNSGAHSSDEQIPIAIGI